MLRKGRFKYHYYIGLPAELFDLEKDPEETNDLASDSNFEATIKDMERELRLLLDPETIDKKAKADQAEIVRKFGGRVKASAAGAKGATPAPGKENE
jgi:choline-sulfatase